MPRWSALAAPTPLREALEGLELVMEAMVKQRAQRAGPAGRDELQLAG